MSRKIRSIRVEMFTVQLHTVTKLQLKACIQCRFQFFSTFSGIFIPRAFSTFQDAMVFSERIEGLKISEQRANTMLSDAKARMHEQQEQNMVRSINAFYLSRFSFLVCR